MRIYALRSIKKNEEITISYGPNFTNLSVKERKMRLSNTFFFDCACKACVNDWPQASDLKDETFVFYPFCKKSVDVFKHRCQDGKVRRIFEDIKLKINMYKTAHAANAELKKFSPDTEQLALKAISALGKFVVPPCRIFFHCQDTLQLCRSFELDDMDYI